MELSDNTIERICKVFGYLNPLERGAAEFVSSKELAKAIGTTEYTVRKDISLLGVCGYTRKGYAVKSLKEELGRKLNLNKKRKACIVGLGRLGSALLDYEKFQEDGFEIVAGFDCSINKLERIKTPIDVFSDNDIKEIVAQRSIEVGILAVPSQRAQDVADKLIGAGVKGILNFSNHKVIVPENVIYLNLDFTNALRFIAAKIMINQNQN
ncbi:MAG: redox-sensing transcriptional repressor Rex [Candidatus Omnitrophica bacterium]|nr:redox-sensing transcriptional repressor Rex [Candidatus Omnitrophota bacterium]